MELNEKQLEMCEKSKWDFSDLRALFINCTLKKSPEMSHTDGLIRISQAIMEKNKVNVEALRAVDHDIAYGVWPDMTEHGWEKDEWPDISKKVMAADILVLTNSIWLGEKTSVCTKVIERLYGNSHLLNEAGQYAYYGRVGGCLITGNEDGAKHCAMNILYSLQHLGLLRGALWDVSSLSPLAGYVRSTQALRTLSATSLGFFFWGHLASESHHAPESADNKRLSAKAALWAMDFEKSPFDWGPPAKARYLKLERGSGARRCDFTPRNRLAELNEQNLSIPWWEHRP